MDMNDMMGLLQQMKRRMLPDPGTDPGKGPGSMRIPGQLGGRGMDKDMPSPSPSGGGPTRGEIAGRVMLGADFDNVTAIQEMIARLREQMNAPGISVADQRAILQQIMELEAQLEQITQQPPQVGQGGVLRMGTSSSGGNYGGESAAERRLRRQRELAAGRPWVITGSGGGGSAGGGNPFGWMGGGFSSPDTPGIRRGGG